MSSLPDPLCERARAWASLDLDGELSDLERMLLEDHLVRCEPCASFVLGIRSTAQVLRTATLERPERPLVLPRRRRPAAVAMRVSAAAAVLALATGLGFLGSSLGGKPAGSTTTEPEIAFLSPSSADREIKNLRAKEPAPTRQPIAPPGRQGGVV